MNKFFLLILTLCAGIADLNASSTQSKLQGRTKKQYRTRQQSLIQHNSSSKNVIEFEQSKAQELKALIEQHENVVVDFYMEGCPPCKKFLQDLPALAHEFPQVTFIKSKNNKLKSAHGVLGNPTFIFFKNGQQVHRKSGYSSKPGIQDPIHKYLLND